MKIKSFINVSKEQPIDLSNENELFESFEFGHKRFTLHRYVPIKGHDDSLPYQADLYLNGKGLCHCFNDGWGGETMLTPMGRTKQGQLDEIKHELKNYKYKYKDTLFNFTLDFIADSIACCKDYQRI